ncbi:hypothetical protein GFL91_04035 [Rhizobium leguminosarum bv. viciae]|uniref:Uncharacterized protein n=3 Tax=Rhizobium TaxID=379 RepID=A0A6N9ZE23_9HYPH|nr:MULTISPECIES: hypothetical protein [Rhizobium]ASR06761.1 hypothetical protein CHY08_06315 [Rhizobium leguminosarum bv. viciae]MBY5312384.1 hypothetical protein [Rhizobium leguminosarum]MBY5328623.1 hypothetical protein [Rhizobium leguminosarum]MBY5396921.1 hypothetical protein [Rhizobium leguminosarum]MBY5547252.1 hypothetical protein [Rhizobium leguminosarum]
MFISFREAADLGLQIVLALTLTMSGMAVASYAVRNDKAKISAIDVSRPSLWTAAPVRVDLTTQTYLRADAPAGLELASGADDLCHDPIGLRLSCNLITTTASTAF